MSKKNCFEFNDDKLNIVKTILLAKIKSIPPQLIKFVFPFTSITSNESFGFILNKHK